MAREDIADDQVQIQPPEFNISALARQYGVHRKTISRRLAKGWRPEQADGEAQVDVKTAPEILQPVQTAHTDAHPAHQEIVRVEPTIIIPRAPLAHFDAHPLRTPAHCGRNWPLTCLACGIAVVGLSNNVWFAHTQGGTETAGTISAALAFVVAGSAFLLPDQIARLAAGRCWFQVLIAAALWSLTFAYELNNSVGFASLNIADITLQRSARSSSAIEEAQRALADAKKARDQECVKLGPICRERQDAVADKQKKLEDARKAIADQADPQTKQMAKLVAWLTQGRLAPSADDLAMFRLTLLTLLPQVGGLVLMVARR
jgi:hypothetical protein